jgi:hypothetical protein
MNIIHPHFRGVLEKIERDIGKSKLEERLLKYSIGIGPKDSKYKNTSQPGLSNLLTFNFDVNDHSMQNITPLTPSNRSRFSYDENGHIIAPVSPEKDDGPKFIQFRDIMKATAVEDQTEQYNDPKNFVNVVKADEHVIKSKVQRHSCPKCIGKIICLIRRQRMDSHRFCKAF